MLPFIYVNIFKSQEEKTMRNKQLFALFLAAAVAVQPQMVSASDSVEQAAETGSSAVVEEAEETQESTEVKAQAQTTESAEKETAQQETATETAQKEKQTKKETGIDQSAMKKEKAQTKSEKTAEKNKMEYLFEIHSIESFVLFEVGIHKGYDKENH